MRSLFWKIFLSFWLALVLFAVSVLWASSHFLDELREQQNGARPFARMQHYLEEARGAARSQGLEGLKAWARHVDRREAVPLLLIDAEGGELLGRTVPERLARRLERRARANGERPHSHPPRRIALPDGSSYLLLPDFTAITLGRVLARPRVLLIPFLTAALISALVCLLLVRYLTAPITRLERATKRLAEGELSHRVSADMGRRRDELADLAASFDHMAERLEAAMASQRRLLSDVSHELRSPLARLQVALGLAQRSNTEPQVETELERIEREAERLNELIGQLLSLSRLEGEKPRRHFEHLDLQELVQEVVDNARYEAQAWEVAIHFEETDPAPLHGDYSLLSSALENIVRNAIKYSPEHGEVTVRLQQTADAYRIEVCDRGPGVPETELALLFEPFVRVGEARDRASGGVGLGLAIAARALHLHSGRVEAENRRGGGLRVIATLPLQAEPGSAAP